MVQTSWSDCFKQVLKLGYKKTQKNNNNKPFAEVFVIHEDLLLQAASYSDIRLYVNL